MKAIETEYKGYRFRSRLEARWAVFFDSLGYRWEYEPEGFEFDSGVRYLPDFKIFGTDTNGDEFVFWAEVKPSTALSKPEIEKVRAFANEIAVGYQHLILLDGPPALRRYSAINDDLGDEDLFCFPYWMWSYRRRPWFAFEDARHGENFGYMDFRYHREKVGIEGRPSADLMKAISSARGARFEHGETPHHGS